MPRACRTLLVTSLGLAALTFGAETASARIDCKGAFQIVDGQSISTPYCEDSYLAVVAREYGLQVSASAVRWNPSVKESVCRTIGHDIRANSACAGYRKPFLERRF